MQRSNFDVIDKIFCKLVDKEKECGRDSLTPEEQVVLSVWHASGTIENGGFQYLVEQGLDAEAVARAYEVIGCTKCAELLRLASSLFPDPLFRSGRSERVQYVERNAEMFGKLSNAFWEADQEMEERLAEYIGRHADKICTF